MLQLTDRRFSSIQLELWPICLDLGTITQKHLDDPFYMGIRDKPSVQEMQEIIDEFMNENEHCFPKKLCYMLRLSQKKFRIALN